jgi:acyl-coenzyme A thioesterase PaaI-like protein
MQLYVINSRLGLRSNQLITWFATVSICIFLVTPCVALNFDTNPPIRFSSYPSAAGGNDEANDNHGPTMIMSYSKEKFVRNPIASFMYFVPLIAPTLVDNISSVNNDQQVGVISWEKKVTSRSFNVFCKFEILGSGFHMNTFDAAGMIAAHTDNLKKGETLKNMLDYIRFDGEGFGIIEVKGEVTGSKTTVTEVKLNFTAGGRQSPVTIGLYDIKPRDGEYKYENRSNEVVARVNTLAFNKTEQTPRMGIEVASIAKKNEPAGFFGRIKGVIANLCINPPKIDKFGNTTMLEFGNALLQRNTTFTFPKAKNIKESKIVEMGRIQR